MDRWSRLLVFIAGIYGAVGVGLAALAAHSASGPALLQPAATFLLLHASVIAATGLTRPPNPIRVAASVLAFGAFLFSGDLALRALAGLTPWPQAAPTGGMLLIIGWLALAGAALWQRDSAPQKFN